MTSSDAILVYAITGANTAPIASAVTDILGAPIHLEAGPALSALVSYHQQTVLEKTLSSAPAVDLQTFAMAYHQRLSQLSASHNILPVRFGTILPDRQALQTYLSTNQHTLAEKLKRTEGHLEWTIRLRRAPEANADAPQVSPATYLRARHLAHRKAAQANQNQRDLARTLMDHLAADLAQHVIAEPLSDDLIAGGCFANVRALCPRGASSDVGACVSALVANDPAIEADIYGPEPPYRFASFEAELNAA